jgi:hypothetical protein
VIAAADHRPPDRVWQRRVKGARIGNAVSVVRGTRYGNPYAIGSDVTREQAVALFRLYALQRLAEEPRWLNPLRGRNLACYCKPGELCHADVLLELANR